MALRLHQKDKQHLDLSGACRSRVACKALAAGRCGVVSFGGGS